MFRKTCLAAVVAAATLGPVPAFAQTAEERAGARAAAMEGERAFDEGRYADAIDLFSRAEKLVHAPPHQLYIARAHEKLGQLVQAREMYIKVNLEELGPRAPRAFRDAQDTARQELGQLEPRIPYVTVTVEGAEDARVTMDDQPVSDALVGVPRPVDPGTHKLQAFAEGMQSEETTVTLDEGEREKVVLTLQPAQPGTAPPGVGPADAPPADPGAPPPDTTGSADGMSGLMIGSLVGFGVGAVGTIGGIVFLVQKSNKDAEADSLFESCGDLMAGCNAEQRQEIEDVDSEAASAGTLSAVSFVVGGLGIATGVTLLVLDLTGPEETALQYQDGDVEVRPWVGYRSAGLSGTF